MGKISQLLNIGYETPHVVIAFSEMLYSSESATIVGGRDFFFTVYSLIFITTSKIVIKIIRTSQKPT